MSDISGILNTTKNMLQNNAFEEILASESCGNTLTRERFINKYIQQSREILNSFGLSESEKKDADKELTKYCKTSLAKYYDNSLKKKPREINGKIPFQATAEQIKAFESQKKYIEEETIRLARLYISDSEKNKTPLNEDVFTNYTLSQMENLISQLPDDAAKDYITSYSTRIIKSKSKKIYDDSIKNFPRTNSIPKDSSGQSVSSSQTSSANKKEIKPSSIKSVYGDTYVSFAGNDMVCVVEMPLASGGKYIKVIGSLQTVSYSIHDEKTPVRCLGDMNPKAYIFGPRTVAGTLIFTVFNRHWMQEMMQEYLGSLSKFNAHAFADEFPPFNMTISMMNEYGSRAKLAIYGVTLVNEGQVMSVNDIFTENTFQFYAMDIDYLTDLTAKTSNKNKNKSESDFLTTESEEKNSGVSVANNIPLTVNSAEQKIKIDPAASEIKKKGHGNDVNNLDEFKISDKMTKDILNNYSAVTHFPDSKTFFELSDNIAKETYKNIQDSEKEYQQKYEHLTQKFILGKISEQEYETEIKNLREQTIESINDKTEKIRSEKMNEAGVSKDCSKTVAAQAALRIENLKGNISDAEYDRQCKAAEENFSETKKAVDTLR